MLVHDGMAEKILGHEEKRRVCFSKAIAFMWARLWVCFLKIVSVTDCDGPREGDLCGDMV